MSVFHIRSKCRVHWCYLLWTNQSMIVHLSTATHLARPTPLCMEVYDDGATCRTRRAQNGVPFSDRVDLNRSRHVSRAASVVEVVVVVVVVVGGREVMSSAERGPSMIFAVRAIRSGAGPNSETPCPLSARSFARAPMDTPSLTTTVSGEGPPKPYIVFGYGSLMFKVCKFQEPREC